MEVPCAPSAGDSSIHGSVFMHLDYDLQTIASVSAGDLEENLSVSHAFPHTTKFLSTSESNMTGISDKEEFWQTTSNFLELFLGS